MGVHSDPARAQKFKEGFARAGKKLDIGKSCVRFKSPDDLALDAIAETISTLSVDGFIELYARSRSTAQKARAAKKPAPRAAGPAATKVARKPAAKKNSRKD